MKKRNAIITAKIKKTYQVVVTNKRVSVHSPAYVSIDKDDGYEVTRIDHVLSIQNSKVCVTLWLKTKHMHVTVFS